MIDELCRVIDCPNEAVHNFDRYDYWSATHYQLCGFHFGMWLKCREAKSPEAFWLEWKPALPLNDIKKFFAVKKAPIWIRVFLTCHVNRFAVKTKVKGHLAAALLWMLPISSCLRQTAFQPSVSGGHFQPKVAARFQPK
jgi:hypothetical protein